MSPDLLPYEQSIEHTSMPRDCELRLLWVGQRRLCPLGPERPSRPRPSSRRHLGGAGKADQVGAADYCSTSSPCAANLGDCDSDSECQAGLRCIDDVGADYGFESWVDVCATGGTDPVPVGGVVCTSDTQCASGYACRPTEPGASTQRCQARATLGNACSDDRDCAQGSCELRTGYGYVCTVAALDVCSQDTDCPGRYTCRPQYGYSTEATCRWVAAAGEGCTSTENCAGSLTCGYSFGHGGHVCQ